MSELDSTSLSKNEIILIGQCVNLQLMEQENILHNTYPEPSTITKMNVKRLREIQEKLNKLYKETPL